MRALELVSLLVWLLPASSCVGASPDQRPVSCSPADRQQFYFEATTSCKNCSDLEQMFDNYARWLTRQLGADSSNSTDQSKLTTGSLSSTSRDDARTTVATTNQTTAAKEVSLFKSGGRGNGRTNSFYDSDVALSRLIKLEDHTGSQEDNQDEYPDPESSFNTIAGSLGSQSSSSSAYLDSSSFGSDSGSDFIKEQTRHVTKFVSQFVRFQPLIGDRLFTIMDDCRQNQNVSACQMWSNLCVMTMYSYSDKSLSSSHQADHYRRYDHDHETISSNSANNRMGPKAQHQHSPREGLHDDDGWQHCKQFTIASICNSLRDWYRVERKSIGVDGDSQSIYATLDEPFSLPIGGSGGSLPVPGLVMRPNQPLQLLAYRYSFDGNLVGVDQFGPAEMERFCLRSSRSTNLVRSEHRQRLRPLRQQTAGYFSYGKNMELNNCRLTELEALQFLQEERLNDTQFIDLYIAYPSGSSMLIKPVPILVKNLLYNGNLINQKYSKDPSRWRLVHRFFYHSIIINSNLNPEQTGPQELQSNYRSSGGGIGGKTSELKQDQLSLLYAKSVVLDLKFRKLDKGALLSSILLTIDYGIVSRPISEFASSASSSTSLKQENKSTPNQVPPPIIDYLDTKLLVEQSLIDMQTYKKDLDLAITILSILSSIWSLIKCYNIQKCRGNVKLDLESLVRFVTIGCDTIALLLAAVLFIFVTYLFILLKFQHSSVQVMAPNEQLELSLMLILQLAFAFKSVGLIHKLYVLLHSDIFFIDWEKPRMLTSSQILNLSYQQQQPLDEHASSKQDMARPLFPNQHQQQQQQQQVSFWRPYTVINRWSQMQTLRRLDINLQLIVFVLVVHLTQATQLASADLSFDFNLSSDDNSGSQRLIPRQSLVFRAMILAYIYLSLAVCQIVYKKYFYEPLVRDTVREFVDLCSVANVSVFCWLYPRFGYYIHGRNANGPGDRGIGEMNALLEREERDLCSKRGLAPNSDQQTFIMILPKVINDHYRGLLSREPTSFATKLSSVASNQLIGKQLFNPVNQPISTVSHDSIGNNNGRPESNSLLQSALNLSASSASLSGTGSSQAAARSSAFSCRSQIDSQMAKHKSIQQFLTNFLEHVYKDIDYAIREGRKFENLLLLDFDFDDEALISLPGPVGGGTRSPSSNPATQPILAQQQHQQQRYQPASFCKDGQNSFTSLLWIGLELDLVLVELLSFLALDLWLGQPAPLITSSLIWLMHHTFKTIYVSCSRYNLITKALVDEKFLFKA